MKHLKKAAALLIAASAAFGCCISASAEKVSFKNDCEKGFYEALIKATKSSDPSKYYDKIAREDDMLLTQIVSKKDLPVYNSSGALIIDYSVDGIDPGIRAAKGFDLIEKFELYVSDEVYYYCEFSLLKKNVITVKELRKASGIPDGEKITAIRMGECMVIDSAEVQKLEPSAFESFWDEKDEKRVSGVSLIKCPAGKWFEYGGNKYYIKKDGALAVKNRTIGGIRYKFGADGVCKGKFTGYTKSGGVKKYWKDGVLQNDADRAGLLKEVREHMREHFNEYGLIGVSTEKNCVVAEVEKVNDKLQRYIDSLSDSSLLRVEITIAEETDD